MGLPLGLVVKGFHLNIFLAALASGILCIWPNQLSLWVLVWLSYSTYSYKLHGRHGDLKLEAKLQMSTRIYQLK